MDHIDVGEVVLVEVHKVGLQGGRGRGESGRERVRVCCVCVCMYVCVCVYVCGGGLHS